MMLIVSLITLFDDYGPHFSVEKFDKLWGWNSVASLNHEQTNQRFNRLLSWLITHRYQLDFI